MALQRQRGRGEDEADREKDDRDELQLAHRFGRRRIALIVHGEAEALFGKAPRFFEEGRSRAVFDAELADAVTVAGFDAPVCRARVGHVDAVRVIGIEAVHADDLIFAGLRRPAGEGVIHVPLAVVERQIEPVADADFHHGGDHARNDADLRTGGVFLRGEAAALRDHELLLVEGERVLERGGAEDVHAVVELSKPFGILLLENGHGAVLAEFGHRRHGVHAGPVVIGSVFREEPQIAVLPAEEMPGQHVVPAAFGHGLAAVLRRLEAEKHELALDLLPGVELADDLARVCAAGVVVRHPANDQHRRLRVEGEIVLPGEAGDQRERGRSLLEGINVPVRGKRVEFALASGNGPGERFVVNVPVGIVDADVLEIDDRAVEIVAVAQVAPHRGKHGERDGKQRREHGGYKEEQRGLHRRSQYAFYSVFDRSHGPASFRRGFGDSIASLREDVKEC